MRQMFMLGQKEHMDICFSFAHFEAYGIMSFEIALEHLGAGLIKAVDVSLFPVSGKLTAIELTPMGKRDSKTFRKLWNEIYLSA